MKFWLTDVKRALVKWALLDFGELHVAICCTGLQCSIADFALQSFAPLFLNAEELALGRRGPWSLALH